MNEIRSLLDELKSIKLAKAYLEKLAETIAENERELERLERVLEKEYDDLRQFEGIRLKDVFFKVLESRKEQYEIERQEYLMAVLHHRECKKVLDLLRYEELVLTEKVGKEAGKQRELDNLIRSKEQTIAQLYPRLKDVLKNIDSQLYDYFQDKRELHEALLLGIEIQSVIKKLIQVLNYSKKHEAWGFSASDTEDKLKEKETKVKRTLQGKAIELKALLYKFEVELADVYTGGSIREFTLMEDIHNFNQIYYYRLMSDWIIRNKLSSTVNFLKGTRDSVRLIIEGLKAKMEGLDRSIAYLENKKQDLIKDEVGK
ncbi:MAG: hypothetical protein AAFO03_10620 [Bacteroidota bacterium]